MEHLAWLQPRQYYPYYYNCGIDNVNCQESAWSRWIRWVVLAVIIVVAIFVIFLCSCLSARRRRRYGRQPFYGTRWMAHGPVTYNANANGDNAPMPEAMTQSMPPQNTGAYQSNAGYYGNVQTPVNTGGANQSYYGNAAAPAYPAASHPPSYGQTYEAPAGMPPSKR